MMTEVQGHDLDDIMLKINSLDDVQIMARDIESFKRFDFESDLSPIVLHNTNKKFEQIKRRANMIQQRLDLMVATYLDITE